MVKSSKVVICSVLVIVVISILACGASGTLSCPPQGSESCDPQLPHITTATGWWVDMTGTVSPETLRQLNAESEAIQKDGFQLAGIIVSNAVSDPSKVASDFGNLNGVGYADKDNGVVVLILLDKAGNDGNKPYIFMAPGSGLSYLTATKLGQIRDQVFKPARASGKWEEGVIEVTKTIHAIMLDPKAGEYLDKPQTSDGSGHSVWFWIIVILIVLLLLVLFGLLGGGTSSSGGSFISSSSDDGGSSSSSIGGGGGFSGGGSGG